MKYSRVQIDTIGYHLAPEVVSSEELEERLSPLYSRLGIKAGQLETMTGIRERRFWPKDFTVTQGASLAAQDALARSGIPLAEMEVLIYAGVCREHFEPATACHVAADLREKGHALHPDLALFDVSNACLGVLNGMLDLANRIELGQIRAGMVVSCESAREIIDITTQAMLEAGDVERFRTGIATMTGGSGAVAVILSDGSLTDEEGHKLLGATIKSAPQHHWLCRWGVTPNSETGISGGAQEFMHTDSVAVLKHGVALGKETWRAFTEDLQWSQETIDRVISHQVGSGHREHILEALGIPQSKDFVAYEYLGNTGTVALPLAAALADERGFLEKGQQVGFLGIGSGLGCMMLGLKW